MATTQVKPKVQPESVQQQNAVAVLPPPRLPPPPNLEKDFGLDANSWRTMVEAVFPAARSTQAVSMALAYCKARHLDPFKRVVHIVPIYDSQKRAYVETVWPGIAEIRTTAMRTQGYAGLDRPEFGDMITETFEGRIKDGDQWKALKVELTFPEWCAITVWRFVQGQRVPFPGPRIWFHEIYNPINRFAKVPNDRWQRSPSQMLEKCAEAAALRRAFPEELGDEWSAEEAGGMAHTHVDITTEQMPPGPEPRRADFTETPPNTPSSGPATPHSEGPGDGQPGEKSGAGPTDTPGQPKVTDVIDESEKKPEEEQIEFPVLKSLGKFYEFSDTFLQSAATTPAMARQWEEHYRKKIGELLTHENEARRSEINDTLALYHAKIKDEEPK